LNESQFTGYHRFGTTARIVKDAAPPQPQDVPPPPVRLQEVSPPAGSNVAAKQNEAIPDENKPAAVPDLAAPPTGVSPAHEVAQAAQDSQNTPAKIEVNVNRAIVRW